MALEFLDHVPDLDIMIVPADGSGQMAGCAAARAIIPKIKLITLQTRQFPSLDPDATVAGGITIADGIAVKAAGDITRPIVADLFDQMVLVEEDQVKDWVRRLVEGQSIVAEGAGGVAVAGLLSLDKAMLKGKRVGLVISGGNIDARLLATVLIRGLLRDGRLARLRIAIYDQPGMLAKAAKLIGDEGGNIVEVTHQRMFFDVPIRRTDLDVAVETVDADHVKRLIEASARPILKPANFPTRRFKRFFARTYTLRRSGDARGSRCRSMCQINSRVRRPSVSSTTSSGA
ncbi:MAG: pyridoxal-phosphate dependent enzyme [Rhodospirillaceae bacterium]